MRRIPWLPGFRSGTPWKRAVAVFGYAFLALLVVSALSPPRTRPLAAVPTERAPTTAPPTVPPPTAIPPTVAPTVAPAVAPPTTAPTTPPAPTAVPTVAPRVTSVASQPCLVGQVKANRNSGIFHVPTGASYGVTTVNVQCFDTAAQAQAAGFRQAER